MHVLLTGATGFVGGHVLSALRDRGHTVHALVRGDGAGLPDGVETARGDVTDLATLGGAFDGIDAVVHLVGIIDESPSKGVTFEKIHVDGTRNVAFSAREAGVTRFVHMSANGARADGSSAYQTTKWRAEEVVRGVGFEHLVIFRPSTLFGDPGPDNPEFAKRLWETLVQPFPVLPVFGKGDYELQPIHVAACADAMAQAVDRDASAGMSYCVAGPERIPYRDVLDRIARGGGIEPKPTARVPIVAARLGVNTLGKAGLLPISPAQFEMLVEGNTCDPTAFFADFGVDTPRFDAESLAYLRQY
ncbi:NAD-dependent epimerase/dehydratase family protein [Rubrivirga sp. IMCC45206]|uniref:NAD-dependent epimerase/dehydratase family protein n=1 Tax=Rubrivirga sp. IMCC45206 TaxID=3391614 RepID=UPI00398FAD08